MNLYINTAVYFFKVLIMKANSRNKINRNYLLANHFQIFKFNEVLCI